LFCFVLFCSKICYLASLNYCGVTSDLCLLSAVSAISVDFRYGTEVFAKFISDLRFETGQRTFPQSLPLRVLFLFLNRKATP